MIFVVPDDEIKEIAQKLKKVYGLIRDRKSLNKEISEQKKIIKDVADKKEKVKTSKQKLKHEQELKDAELKKKELLKKLDQNKISFKDYLKFVDNPDIEPVFDIINN